MQMSVKPLEARGVSASVKLFSTEKGLTGVSTPLASRVDDASEGKSPMWMQMSVKPLEAKISRL